jgi:MOSC domain-containing protein YiiM
MAKVVAVSVSPKKGMRKKNVPGAKVIENFGIEGDAHASSEWHRQVSLLAIESIDKMRKAGLNVNPGDFAENITTEGIDLVNLPIGTRIKVGKEVVGEVSQIGKECHTRCAIYYQAGDCVMPKEGIFITVVSGGWIAPEDEVTVVS